ncbi:hypothetical protein [Coxiella-like endosymbiont]|uniref:hypothetical protein n=1 Tax=Coxiella-like endosymbiont TaxID=1592897 RepID=UPI00272951A2|nr:hypothetical protein [Coxiella-like endosymbiont]
MINFLSFFRFYLFYLQALPAYAGAGWFSAPKTTGIGLSIAIAGKHKMIYLILRPTNFSEPRYESDRDMDVAGLFGVWLVHQFCFGLALRVSYLDYPDFEGTVHPFVNIAPDFDTLHYSYETKSYLLLAQSQFKWARNGVQPYFSVGLGMA